MTEKARAFWADFLREKGLPADTPCLSVFHFDNNRGAAAELLAMVLSGRKRATSSALPSYAAEGEMPPKVGDLSIVTDFDGDPHCVIRTAAITVVPFGEMTYDICRREGEDDTLASWQETHTRFFSEDAAALGYAFTPEMPVLFEDFEVVYAR